MRVETHAQASLPDALRRQVAALDDIEWPPDPDAPARPFGHDPALHPVYVLLVDDAVVVASLALLSKPLTHGGATLRATGLSAVVTAPAYRGHGHGHALVTAARDVAAGFGADLVLFTCDAHLVAFYERTGYAVLPGAVLVGGTPAEPLRSDSLAKTTMAAFLTERAQGAAGAFEHCDIELFPGPIDRLW